MAPLKVSNANLVTNLNADLLDGQDSSAYRNKTFVYSLTGSSATQDTAFTLPGLPAGKYLASYSVAAVFTTAPSNFACFFIAATGSVATIKIINAGIALTQSYVSASGYLDTTAQPYVLDCEKGGGGTMALPIPPANIPSQVVLTRVDDVTPGAGTAGPITLTSTSRPGSAGRVLP